MNVRHAYLPGPCPCRMAVPERRHRGYVVVLVLVLAGALAVLPVFFLRPPARPGPAVLLIRATDTISATPSNASVTADFGPFCAPVAWDAGQGVLAVQADLDLAGVEGILVNHYVEGSSNFASNGGDHVRPTVLVQGGAWHLASPADGHALATFVRSGENVTVNGTTYGRGAQWSLHFEYDVPTSGGNAHVIEDVQFENAGVVPTRTVPVEPCV